MTLRLSSSPSSSKQGSIDSYLKQLHDDTSISLAQKNDCLKTLTIILKNLIDPSKGGNDDGLKYRTIKIDNPKIQSRLFFCPANSSSVNNNHYIKELLTNSSLIGMVLKENVLMMEEIPSSTISDTIAMQVMPAIAATQSKMASKLIADSANNKRAKLSTIVHPLDKLSEKQKARILLEEKKLLEKKQDKLHRIATRRQMAADKLVRETDENWKPAVSAASAKSGQGLQSFRDRHGES